MDVAVSGSHGLIGSALVAVLEARGDRVRRIVRGAATGDDATWDIGAGTIDTAALAGVDAVVHLAGEGIGTRRWSVEQKGRILDSRVDGTRLLATALAALDPPPAVLVSASAVGFYGDRGDEELTERSTAGTGFLADVVGGWEAATRQAKTAGIRVVHARSGLVLSTDGGALKRQLVPFKLGVGGRVGSGRQYLSWITIDDEVGAILHCLATESLAGPVNLTAPGPVTSAGFARALGAALHRPAVLPLPAAAVKLAFGAEMAKELLLSGQRVLPAELERTGYRFAHAEIGDALRWLVGRSR